MKVVTYASALATYSYMIPHRCKYKLTVGLMLFLSLFFSGCLTKKAGDLKRDYGRLQHSYIDSFYNFSIGLNSAVNKGDFRSSISKQSIQKTGLTELPRAIGKAVETRYFIKSEKAYRLCRIYHHQDYEGFVDAFIKTHKERMKASTISDLEYLSMPYKVVGYDPIVVSYTLPKEKDTLQAIEAFLLLKSQSKILRFTYLQHDRYSARYASRLQWENHDFFRELRSFKDSLTERAEKELSPSPLLFAFNLFHESNRNYLVPTRTLEKYAAEIEIPGIRESYRYTQSLFYSFSGDIVRSRRVWNNGGGYKGEDLLDTSKPTKAVEALKAIGRISQREQVIMLNEHHLNPYCRVFARSLLDTLYQNGYRHLFVETLSADDYLHKRRYPLQQTGTYTTEPMFGNFIRHALALGFTVLPYEAEGDNSGKEDRERKQAENIASFFSGQNLKDRKALIFAGHGHIYKKAKSHRTMANYFTEITGIIPFCIDQASANGNGLRAEDYAYFRKHNIDIKDTPALLVNDETKDYYVPRTLQGVVDAVVIHPPTDYIDGKFAGWLLQQGENKVPIKLNGKRYKEALLSVTIKSEADTSRRATLVPVLNLTLGRRNRFFLSLPANVYYVTVCDENKRRLFFQEIKI